MRGVTARGWIFHAAAYGRALCDRSLQLLKESY
jgi:hypothetical protein